PGRGRLAALALCHAGARPMPVTLTCPRGHSWEVPDNGGEQPLGTAICPVCSEQVTLTPAQRTLALSPPPQPSAPEAATLTQIPGRAADCFHTLPHGRRNASLAAEAAPLEQVPGYEILGELGRGSMGVVFKARQVMADRLVALKMILAGGYAGPRERERFRV